ncbi:MAG: DUF3052 domain-containing protein [bacterium]|nr:DUF3052 domain-containing protein [bacterium]
MTAGYSGSPLAKRLGIRESYAVAVLNGPDDLTDLLEPLPPAVTFRTSARGKADMVMLFTRSRADFERRIDGLGRMIFPDSMIWVCWPKRASKVPTDMSEDVVRAVALPKGLVDVKVCAIDATWSGLKVVWRKEMR